MREYTTAWRATFTCKCGRSYGDWSIGEILVCGDCGRGRETFERIVSREVHRRISPWDWLVRGKTSLIRREFREGDAIRVETIDPPPDWRVASELW
jgi:hypothetical protein